MTMASALLRTGPGNLPPNPSNSLVSLLSLKSVFTEKKIMVHSTDTGESAAAASACGTASLACSGGSCCCMLSVMLILFNR